MCVQFVEDGGGDIRSMAEIQRKVAIDINTVAEASSASHPAGTMCE
jgi:hypothetical protein